MRHVSKRIALSIAVLIMGAIPVLADDTTWGNDATQSRVSNPEQQNGKVECMLVAENNCADVGPNRSARIINEINKGGAVYTKAELDILSKELDKANKELNEDYGW
ncbi:MAG: hypothetical protein ABSA86_13085 [Oryzomonas sp.]